MIIILQAGSQALDMSDKVLNPEFITWLVEYFGVGLSMTVFVIVIIYKLIIALIGLISNPNMIANLSYIAGHIKRFKKEKDKTKDG